MPASICTVRCFLCEAAIVLLTAGLLLQPAWAQKSPMRADAPFYRTTRLYGLQSVTTVWE